LQNGGDLFLLLRIFPLRGSEVLGVGELSCDVGPSFPAGRRLPSGGVCSWSNNLHCADNLLFSLDQVFELPHRKRQSPQVYLQVHGSLFLQDGSLATPEGPESDSIDTSQPESPLRYERTPFLRSSFHKGVIYSFFFQNDLSGSEASFSFFPCLKSQYDPFLDHPTLIPLEVYLPCYHTVSLRPIVSHWPPCDFVTHGGRLSPPSNYPTLSGQPPFRFLSADKLLPPCPPPFFVVRHFLLRSSPPPPLLFCLFSPLSFVGLFPPEEFLGSNWSRSIRSLPFCPSTSCLFFPSVRFSPVVGLDDIVFCRADTLRGLLWTPFPRRDDFSFFCHLYLSIELP